MQWWKVSDFNSSSYSLMLNDHTQIEHFGNSHLHVIQINSVLVDTLACKAHWHYHIIVKTFQSLLTFAHPSRKEVRTAGIWPNCTWAWRTGVGQCRAVYGREEDVYYLDWVCIGRDYRISGCFPAYCHRNKELWWCLHFGTGIELTCPKHSAMWPLSLSSTTTHIVHAAGGRVCGGHIQHSGWHCSHSQNTHQWSGYTTHTYPHAHTQQPSVF